MSYISEFISLTETIRDSQKRITESRNGFELQSEAEEKWDEILKKYKRNSWEMVGNLNISFRNSSLGVPWAIIVFPEEYRLSGHLLSIRTSNDDFSFSAYSIRSGYSIQKNGIPPVSMIFMYRRPALEQAALKSPMLLSAWKILENLPETRNWFCISDSPSADWIAKAEKDDDILFKKRMSL